MATEEKASTSDEGVSWWSSWVQTAKDKSVSALSATTRDLAEFVTVVHRDTAQAVSGAASTIKVMVSGGEEEKEAENSSKVETDGETAGDGALSYDRSVTQLNMLRSSTDTYCAIPDGHAAQFLEWSAGFDLPGSQDTISLLLVESPDVRRLHTELVPAMVSYESFWHHYFYRVHLMEQEHAHRAAIMARAESQGKLIDWDEDEEEEEVEEEARDRSGSSDSFICIGDETGVETTADDSMPNKDDTTTAHDVSQQQKETTSQEKEKTKREGGKGNDSDSEWERWSD